MGLFKERRSKVMIGKKFEWNKVLVEYYNPLVAIYIGDFCLGDGFL